MTLANMHSALKPHGKGADQPVRMQHSCVASVCTLVSNISVREQKIQIRLSLCIRAFTLNKKNYNMILSCYNYGRVTIIYDAIVNY